MSGVARNAPTVLHVDLDAFFAAVEQRDKPSLRGKPVVVGGLGPRGVVATASYEARAFGIRSAMSMAEARSRCRHAAFLGGRFGAYRQASAVVMGALAELSSVVEPLSLDEAFVDLAVARPDAGTRPAHTSSTVHALAERLRETIVDRTSLTASVGAATSKLMAKIASEQAKPDGLLVVEPGTELELLHPLPVRAIPGVGPATGERLGRLGVRTVGELAGVPEDELVGLLGEAHGRSLHGLAHGRDDRRVSVERDSKSVSIEDTFDTDITDRALLGAVVRRMAGRVADRLAKQGMSGRTITLKARLHDFTTLSRSATVPGPTDDPRVVGQVARRLLDEIDTSGGIRLVGVGVSGLSHWVQQDLFAGLDDETPGGPDDDLPAAYPRDPPTPTGGPRRWVPGMDVRHTRHGPGWVWGSGLGRVTIRFETADTGPGPVRTFSADDSDLTPTDPAGPSE